MKNNDIGSAGEELAARYLASTGMEILHRNWRTKRLEVDIIALDKADIVFVEVKKRSSNFFGNPLEGVNRTKQENLIAAAEDYLTKFPSEHELRFDVIGLDENDELDHIKNAFTPEW